MWIQENRRWIIGIFVILGILSTALLPFLNFSFDFERFFPDGDPDLEYYKEFVEEFESDDNYLLIALTNQTSVLETDFLTSVKELTESSTQLKSVVSAISLPTLQKPEFGPLGIQFSPLFPVDERTFDLMFDSLKNDQSIIRSMLAPDKKSIVVALKIEEHLQIDGSLDLMKEITTLVESYNFENYHFLGRAYFQNELARLQLTEVLYSSIFSFLVVSLILFLLYRNKYLIFITLISISLGLLLFMGLLSLMGRELDAISALYPVLMLIVGSSDVIHILSKYLDELRKDKPIGKALDITIRQIGLATFFTSATTAIGFVSLFTSRIGPVRDFGVNAAIGVLVAYVTIILFTTALLTYFSPEKLKTHAQTFKLWDLVAEWFYNVSKRHIYIISFTSFLLLICGVGISKISTDYKIESSLPKGKKVTQDFLFFEKNYSGYRPMEYVLTKRDQTSILDTISLQTVKRLSEYISSHPDITQVTSVSTLIQSLKDYMPTIMKNQDEHLNIPPQLLVAALKTSPLVLINEARDKTRISAQIKDIGAYKIKRFTNQIQNWYDQNIDTSAYALNYTGTGVIIDKNAVYVRESLLKGLGLALLIIGILMGLMFKSFRMLFISLIPNSIPLLIAGAILGFSGIPLEPLTSITFVVIFGIAVDDTIHFLSKYRLALHSGLSVEESIRVSFDESGKAILFTSVVLFFGFMVMLFSYNPASVIVGGLISVTLFTAVFADLILLPVLIRYWLSPN